MNKNLTKGNPARVLWSFCIPLLGSIVFQQAYNIADSLVAGKFIGENALAAVGNSYEVTLIYLAFAFGCNMGCSVVVSQFFGAKDFRGVKTAVTTASIYTAAVCAVLMAVGIAFNRPLLHLIRTPEELLEDSRVYLEIYTLGLPFLFFYNVANGIFSAMGDSKTPFYFLAASSTANIFMDIFFVKGLGMGVEGVAWATLLCQSVSCVLSLIFVAKRMRAVYTGSAPLFDKAILTKILAIALPSTAQQSFVSVGNIIIQSVINSFGAAVIAGYAAAIKLNNLVITCLVTLGNGISNYAAQNYGAKRIDRIRQGFRAGLPIMWSVAIPGAVLYFFGGRIVLGLFMDNPTNLAIQTGLNFLRIASPFYMLIALKLVADGCLRGAGHMREFMVDTFTDLILRVVLAIVLSQTALGATGIWCAWPVGWGVATIVALWYYVRVFGTEKSETEKALC